MDKVADALTKIRNAIRNSSAEVEVSKGHIILGILEVLKKEGFISGFDQSDGGYTVSLLYENKKPKIVELKKISKPGCRRYIGWRGIRRVKEGRGVGVLSTSRGIMSTNEARSKKLGGEYICQIW